MQGAREPRSILGVKVPDAVSGGVDHPAQCVPRKCRIRCLGSKPPSPKFGQTQAEYPRKPVLLTIEVTTAPPQGLNVRSVCFCHTPSKWIALARSLRRCRGLLLRLVLQTRAGPAQLHPRFPVLRADAR